MGSAARRGRGRRAGRLASLVGPVAALGLLAAAPARAEETPSPSVPGGPPAVAAATPEVRRPALDPVTLRGSRIDEIGLRALRTYLRTELVMAEAQPACGLDWQLLAAIGRVESRHGERGDHGLTRGGLAKPAFVGLPLDGTGDRSAVPDTDGGRLDGDRRWDRPVGPMKLMPSAWATYAVDGDGNGRRNPQDLDDAALATAALLCDDGAELAGRADRVAALRELNDRSEYVRAVHVAARGYAVAPAQPGRLTVATPAPVVLDPPPAAEAEPPAEQPQKQGPKHRDPKPSPPAPPAPPPAPKPPAPVPAPNPAPSPTPTPSPVPETTPTPPTSPSPEPTVEASTEPGA